MDWRGQLDCQRVPGLALCEIAVEARGNGPDKGAPQVGHGEAVAVRLGQSVRIGCGEVKGIVEQRRTLRAESLKITPVDIETTQQGFDGAGMQAIGWREGKAAGGGAGAGEHCLLVVA